MQLNQKHTPLYLRCDFSTHRSPNLLITLCAIHLLSPIPRLPSLSHLLHLYPLRRSLLSTGSSRQRWHGEARLRLEKRDVAALLLDGGGATGERAGKVAAALGCAGEEARRRLCVGNYQVGAARTMAAQGARVSLCGCVC
ncbi:hypothetical protein Droror1_Dr00021139 [Drosera rotundifolia]